MDIKMKKSDAHNDILLKMARFCAYQERSRKEVFEKALSLTEEGDEVKKLVSILEKEGYIDQTRFVESFIRGRFNGKKGGRIKIYHALRSHDISEEEILTGFNKTIADDEYESIADELIKKKILTLRQLPLLQLKQKIFQYMLAKGFETNVIHSLWNKLTSNV
jgi:regulatory protein